MRRGLYRANLLKSARLPVPVVVVGNIFIGGTGKTPLTIWLVQALRDAGMRPGVISRGHGSADRAPRAVSAASTPQQVGDEPLLIFQRGGCPVMVGRDRAQAGRALLAAHPDVDVLVTDDGLQHYALQRDVEIVLFDGRGAGNGWLLPAGPLRESPRRRRDVTVINAPELAPALVASVAPAGSLVVQMLLDGGVAERLLDRSERRPLADPGGQRPAHRGGGRHRQPAAFLCHAARRRTGLRGTALARPSRLPRPAICCARHGCDLDHREGCSKMCAN